MVKGLSVVYTPQVECRTNIDIIFVHGLRGNGKDTWTELGGSNGECFWPKDLLPGAMPIDLQPRIMMFEYDASMVKSRKSSKEKDQLICHFAANLLECVFEKQGGVLERLRPMVFVVHSLGGLVVEECLVQSRLGDSMLFKHTKALVLFGTPHQGSSTATLGVVLGQMASVGTLGRTKTGNHLKQLKPSSPSLQTLEMHLQRLPPQFEPVKLDSAIFRGTLEGAQRVVRLQANHRTMKAFCCNDDPKWAIIRTEFEALLNRLDCQSRIDGEPEGNDNVNTALKPVSHFFGRAQELSSIANYFQHENGMDTQRRTVRLHSLRRKIGTSQIAAKFAAEHGKKYAATLWFDATSPAHFRVSCSTNAYELGLITDAERGQINLECARIKAWLGRGDQLRNLYQRRYCWLVVLDNCRHSPVNDFLGQILPDSPTVGSVLVTTFGEDFWLGEVDNDNGESSIDSNVHPHSAFNDGQNDVNINLNIHPVSDFIDIQDEAVSSIDIHPQSNSNSNGESQDEASNSASDLNTDPVLNSNLDISTSLSTSPFTSNSDNLLLLIEPFSNEALVSFVATTLTAKPTNIQTSLTVTRSKSQTGATVTLPCSTPRFPESITTVRTSAMGELDDSATILSQLTACFGSAGVRWSLFDGPPKTFYDYGDNALHYTPTEAENKLTIRENFDAARQQLLSQGIITPTPDGGDRVHAAFQKEILSRMTIPVRRDRYAWAASLIFGKTPQQKDGHSIILQWPEAQQWLPSMTSLLHQAEKLHIAEMDTKTLDNKTLFLLAQSGRNWAIMLSEQGNYLDAEGIHRQVLMISNRLVLESRSTREQHQSSDGIWTISSINFTTLLLLHADLYSLLGTIAMEQNFGLLAVSRMEEVLKLREEPLKMQTHGNSKYIQQQKDHIDLAVQNVAASHIIAEEPQRELDMLDRLERGSEDGFRPRWRGNQALCLLQLGRLQEAQKLIDTAFVSNTSPWEVARFHFTNANILLRSAPPEIELAEKALNDCLALRLQLIPNHPLTGLTYHKLGKLYQDQKRYSEATLAFSRAVDLLRPACTKSMTYTTIPVLSSTSGIDSTAISTLPTEITYGVSQTKTSLPVTFLVRSLWAYSRALYFENRDQAAGKYQDEAYELINSDKITLPRPNGQEGDGDGAARGDLPLWGLGLQACDASYMKGSWDGWVPVSHR
ncbi:hypothetical protein DL98DRAFT_596469 [Cadophora sp. DSE1049]|nr:hypothetical protein DL98DRAFT_596469 [Cadophora sp. DSE1049]